MSDTQLVLKPKFHGTFQEVKAALDGKIFGGENGKPLTLIDLELSEGKNESPRLDFTFAVSSWDTKFGSTGSEPMEQTKMTVAWVITSGMQEYNYRNLNDGFGLTGDNKLLDDDEDFWRLVASDHPKALKLVGLPTAGMYLTAQVAEKANNEVKAIYFNFFTRTPRDSVTEKTMLLADLKKRFNRSSF